MSVVSLDAFFPGWDGLAEGSAMVARDVLRAVDPGYRRWDWALDRPAEWVPVDPDADLLVEGCGALTPANRERATAGIWVVGAERERRARALRRDGEALAAHWAGWAAQERDHWRLHAPRRLADWWFVAGALRRHGATRGTMGRRPARASPP